MCIKALLRLAFILCGKTKILAANKDTVRMSLLTMPGSLRLARAGQLTAVRFDLAHNSYAPIQIQECDFLKRETNFLLSRSGRVR
jgi:hypothetical protein